MSLLPPLVEVAELVACSCGCGGVGEERDAAEGLRGREVAQAANIGRLAGAT